MLNFHKKILPPLGHRILKTAVAVYICLIIYMLRGYKGAVIQSCIAAIVCMQPYVSDSKSYAFERVLGIVIGSAWGFAYLLFMYLIPVSPERMVIAYAVMALFVMLSIYSTVIIKKTSTASLVAIIYLGIVISYPYVEEPFAQVADNVLDTMIGIIVAIIVNISHLPRAKHPEYLFFVRTMDLVPDRYAQIPSSVHITLDHLYNDGAKICLVSRWAPAFIISQMGLLNVNSPMIIMDGAGLYDIQRGKYLDVIEIPHNNADRLRSILEGFGASCNYYTVRDRTMCIYHSGPNNEAEHEEYMIMKRSPYRNYMDGMYMEDDKIAFIRAVDSPERIEELAYLVRSVLPPGMFRMEMREEAQFPNYRGLYFYDPHATVSEMKHRVTDYMAEQLGETLTPLDILPQTTHYSPEHDAMLLLGRLKSRYEPVSFIPKFMRK